MTPTAQPHLDASIRIVGIRIRTVARLAALSAIAFVMGLVALIGIVTVAASGGGVLTNAGRLVTKLTGAHLHLLSLGALAVYASVALLLVLMTTLFWSATTLLLIFYLRLLDGLAIEVRRKPDTPKSPIIEGSCSSEMTRTTLARP